MTNRKFTCVQILIRTLIILLIGSGESYRTDVMADKYFRANTVHRSNLGPYFPHHNAIAKTRQQMQKTQPVTMVINNFPANRTFYATPLGVGIFYRYSSLYFPQHCPKITPNPPKARAHLSSPTRKTYLESGYYIWHRIFIVSRLRYCTGRFFTSARVFGDNNRYFHPL